MKQAFRLLLVIGLLTPIAAQAGPPAPASSRAPATLPESSATASTAQVLNRVVAEVRFDEAPLDQVLEWLTDTLEINVIVRWRELDAVGITRETPVSLRARDVTIERLLWMVMNAVSPDVRLAYQLEGNMMILSTHADLSRREITRTYDVAELLLVIPNFTNRGAYAGISAPSRQFRRDIGDETLSDAPSARPWPADVPGGRCCGPMGCGPIGFGSGWPSFGLPPTVLPVAGPGAFGAGPPAGAAPPETPDMKATELISVIAHTIEPESWELNGGSGTMQMFGSTLVVRNNVLVHQSLSALLGARETARR